MSIEHFKRVVVEEEIQFVDLRFTDLKGKEQHISLPITQVDDDFLQFGKMFDGSSIQGWKEIHESDMLLIPDLNHFFICPFMDMLTLVLRCDIVEPFSLVAYHRDPRYVAKKAKEYMQSIGIADDVFFGPEPEFFIFDDVKYKTDIKQSGYQIDSEEGCWNSDKAYEIGNTGHRPSLKGGYFPVPPVDSFQDLRSYMSDLLNRVGVTVEAHHHEVATAGQNEIATKFNSIVEKADEIQILKYIVHNVAHNEGKTATFMPKPIADDNGSGMHCHQSLIKDGKNVFAGDQYAGLSQEALYYIGGIIKHAKVINAFANASTNSYKRLVPGFEAPVLLAYSASNRSASIRIPVMQSERAKRIEVRFPDCSGNPYLMFSAMLMAGLDGIMNKIEPGLPMDKNLYALSEAELSNVPKVASSLDEALDELDKNRAFLLKGDVFSNDLIDAYIQLKRQEIDRLNKIPHPMEFDLYYSC